MHFTFGFKIAFELGAKNDTEWARLKAVEQDAQGKISWVNWIEQLKAPIPPPNVKESPEEIETAEDLVTSEKAPGIG